MRLKCKPVHQSRLRVLPWGCRKIKEILTVRLSTVTSPSINLFYHFVKNDHHLQCREDSQKPFWKVCPKTIHTYHHLLPASHTRFFVHPIPSTPHNGFDLFSKFRREKLTTLLASTVTVARKKIRRALFGFAVRGKMLKFLSHQ